MNTQELIDTARTLVAGDKGLLAMDESNPTCNKRFAKLGIPQTEEARRAYRELIVTTPGLGECISGAILYDETIRQQKKDGTPFVKAITDAGIIPGIKVDTGAKDMAGHPGEKITEGLDGLRDRLAEYSQMGARFAKWRAVIAVGDGIPSRGCIEANAQALARYAALCQEAGLVPVVEPEVLMDGEHTLERCREVTEEVLRTVFNQLYTQRVMLEGMILKPNMVLPGLTCPKQETVDEVADATVRCLLRAVPAAVPGIAFLSGGQSGELASARLNAMNVRFKSRLPWALAFSFARAIQQPALEIWQGKEANVLAAQQALFIEPGATGLRAVANTMPRWKGHEHDNKRHAMDQIPLYPLRFEPIYQYRLWGGRRLANLLSAPLPGDGPIGEAWLLSDRDDHPSLVANGPLKGRTIGQLLKQWPEQLLGKLAGRFRRFPLLLKFLDARDTLSVQVHPSDRQTNYLPAGETGKTEAWVVLEAGAESRIYAGLKPATTADNSAAGDRERNGGGPPRILHSEARRRNFHTGRDRSFAGRRGGFEVQENSDVTFRLYDWNHVDAKTGQPRPLQVDQAMACIDFAQGAIGPVVPVVEEVKPVLRERLFDCEHFGLWRFGAESPFGVGAGNAARAGVHRRRRSGGARWRQLCRRQRRCAALAGRGWSVFVPTAWCHELVGNFAAGRNITQ
jgi:fructose-bisphosphate aldolase class I